MKHLLKRSMAMVMTLLLVFSLLSGITFTADAATVDYQYGSTSAYSNIIKNWGTREELATFLSPNAEAFYEDTTYEELAALDGSSDLTAVNASALYVALYELMSSAHTKKNSYEESKYLFQYTDCQNNGSVDSGKISTFYSGTLAGPEWDGGSTFTREHTWPDSMGGSANTTDSARTNETDIMMLRPIPQSENSSRSNIPYGESSGYYDPNKGSYDVRGDAARTILYVYVRWGNEQSAVLDNIWNVFESKEILLSWIEEDPVDTWEMGRNDSVQSITGTRNVFVDYPELAFHLFETEVPANYDTPSGSSSAASFNITAQSNNIAYGTVSVNGSNVTAYPASGYKVAGYQITSGTATVTQNGNLFSIAPTSDCTIVITFEPADMYSVRIVEDGVVKSSQQIQSGHSYTLPAFSGTLPEGYTFRGWTTSQIDNDTAKPDTVYSQGTTYTPQENTTFYALVSWSNLEDTGEGELTYKLVTSLDQIDAGASVIIAAAGYDMAMGPGSSNGNNRTAAAVTKTGDTLVFDSDAGVQVMTLVKGTVDGSLGFDTGSGYLYAASSSSNHLKTKADLDNNGSFAITVNSDGSCTLLAQGTYTRNSLKYNTQSSIFSCYSPTSAGSQTKPVSLYVGVQGGTTYYTTVWTTSVCTHTNTTTATVPATCTAPGSVTVTCADCGEIISTTVLPASHTEVETEIAPTLTQQGYTLLSCGVCGEELGKENYSDPLTNVEGWNLTLGSDLSMNFKVDVHESIRSTAQIHITVANDAKTYNVSELTVADDGYYYLSVKLAAVQMTDLVTVQITNGNDQTGIEIYSVQTYAEIIITGDYPVELQDLMQQMLCYGAAAQIYFNYRVDSLPDVAAWGYEPGTPSTTNVYKVSGELDGISFYGATMMFRDKNAVRFYFDVTGDIDSYTFAVNGKACTPVPKGDRYYIEYADINPQDLNNVITVKVNDTLSVTYSPMNYIVNMRQKGSEKLQELVQTLYDYHVAAVAYLAAN